MILKGNAILVFVLAIFLAGCGSSAARLNNSGNRAYEGEEYGDAVEDYVAAQREDPDLAEPYYNAGNAFYRQGNFEAAAAQEKQALRSSEDALAQNSYYNLGNSYFKVEDWPAAIEAYKEALKLNPDDEEAKYNLELALKQLEQQQQQQQQQSGQGGQPQEESEGGGEQDEQQESNQGQGEEEEEQQGGGGEPEPDESGESGSNPQDQQPQSGPRGLTPQEAEQLLDALGQDSQTLQERLQQGFFAPGLPPANDW